MRQSIVEIRGNKYRYAYDPDLGETIYLGPVGKSPMISEEDFLRKVENTSGPLIITPEQAKKKPEMIRGAKLPKTVIPVKVSVYPNTVRFRIEDPVNFKQGSFAVLDGQNLMEYDWKPGTAYSKQKRRFRREFEHPEGEFRWVSNSLRNQALKELSVDPGSFLVLARPKEGEESQRIQAVVRRTSVEEEND